MFKDINEVRKYQNFQYNFDTAVEQSILNALEALAPTPQSETIIDQLMHTLEKNQARMNRL